MKLPKPRTVVSVDWVEYHKYLENKYPKEWEEIYDALWIWFCGTVDFHNGCYVHMEASEVMGYDEDHAVTWFANRIFTDYGDIADKWGVIKLWVRW